MVFWHWLAAGLLLSVIELLTPGGFFILFFGLSALLVGALMGIGLPLPLWLQLLLFSVLASVSLVLFRDKLVKRLQRRSEGERHEPDDLRNEGAVALGDIPQGDVGKVELRGSAWSARNDFEGPIASGQRCRVTRVDGLTLWVRPE